MAAPFKCFHQTAINGGISLAVARERSPVEQKLAVVVFIVITCEDLLVVGCVDFSCAIQKEILAHGRLYISRQWICFYANIFRWETAVSYDILCSLCTVMYAMYNVHRHRVV